MATILTDNNNLSPALQDLEPIYDKIHNSILLFPDHVTAWHADKLQILPKDFEHIVNAITRCPNTFWGFGPFKKNANGWSIDYLKKTSKKISSAEENKILRKRIIELEASLISTTKALQKYIEIEKREKAKNVACFSSTKFATGVLH